MWLYQCDWILTIRIVWPEADLDAEGLVGVLDGGQSEIGQGLLGEMGHHSICRDRGVIVRYCQYLKFPSDWTDCLWITDMEQGIIELDTGNNVIFSSTVCFYRADWPWTLRVVKASTFPCLLEAVHTYVPESSWVNPGTVKVLTTCIHLGGSSPSSYREKDAQNMLQKVKSGSCSQGTYCRWKIVRYR